MRYPLLTLKQVHQLSTLRTVMISGRVRYTEAYIYLEQADHSLRLIGQPFSGFLRPGQHVEVWGELLQGKQPALLVHDARPCGETLRQPRITPPWQLGNVVLLHCVRVIYHADEQIAMMPDGQQILLYGEELDQRHYAVELELMGLRPPSAMILTAVPITLDTWLRKGTPA